MAKIKELEQKPRQKKYRLILTQDEVNRLRSLVGKAASGEGLGEVYDALYSQAEIGVQWDLRDSSGRQLYIIKFTDKI